MSLSNDPQADVVAGTYTGEEFASEIFDATTDGTGEDVQVAPGACVVRQVSDGSVLFVFVRGQETSGSEAWHRILESGEHPLAAPSDDLIESPVAAKPAPR